jgi:hypothetical protein
VLRKIYRPSREKITGVWRKLHKEKLHYLYEPLNIIMVIKTRKRWVWCVAGPGEGRNAYAASVGKPLGGGKTRKTNKRRG